MKVSCSFPTRGMIGTVTDSDLVFWMRGEECLARSKSDAIQPNSVDQLAVRAFLSASSKAWKTASDAKRTAWDAWAEQYDDNSSGNPSGNMVMGFDVFCDCNFWRQCLGLAIVTDAPAVARPAPVTAIVQGAPSVANAIAFTPTHTVAAGSLSLYKLAIKCTPASISAGRKITAGNLRFAKHIAAASCPTLTGTGVSVLLSGIQFTIPNLSNYGISLSIVEITTGLASHAYFDKSLIQTIV
ncbi:MAG: hypothetical protein NTY46_05390 [Candidatus Sumerlaeota bacterium]|nr:hypothetical protein [Candidatus Sumerlaeota bacterium]